MSFCQCGQVVKDTDICLDNPLDAGSLDLDHYIVPLLCPGAVSLSKRSSRYRSLFECLKEFSQWPAQLRLDNMLCFFKSKGRDTVLKLAEFPDKVWRKQVGPCT